MSLPALTSSSALSPDIALSVDGVSKTYRLYNRPQDRLLQSFYRNRKHLFHEHEALKPVSLTVKRGETVGIVGANGSGKSTLLQIVCGTLTPTTGSVQVAGRISALLELGAGFNPEFSGRENVFLNASILGLSKEYIEARYDEIVRFSGLDSAHMEAAVKTYSSGMFVRLAFAVAIAVEPELLVVDEALAVGDEAFQRKCFARIRQLQENGTAILFVSHASQTIIDLCTRAVWFDAGDMMMQGAPKDIVAAYHKLIYAPASEQPSVRQELLSGKPSAARALVTSSDSRAKAPESCITYPTNGGEITHPRLLDMQGMPVHHLEFGQEYELAYTVRLEYERSNLKFAMLFKTKTGVELTGALFHAPAHALPDFRSSEEKEVRFRFVCRLLPGTYFCNCGLMSQEEGSTIFLHRIVDALQFQVLPGGTQALLHGDTEARGMVDMQIQGIIPSAMRD